MRRLVAEAGVVGLILAIVLGLVAAAAPKVLATPARAALTGLVVGAAFHLAFEAAGLNRMYCTTGHACATK